ncbi:hypothetical protein QN277_003757 [Acacia crassicarpa]|uniref:PGG domain-containing protein n=1 Tax=Acacia crassicarpa TaxID=499986 RepID=A0AAE1J0C4_9FABA|nr:hypothetical protein QN277_003757 [Acacia crassicarpa]
MEGDDLSNHQESSSTANSTETQSSNSNDVVIDVNVRLKLYEAAKQGNWEEARTILEGSQHLNLKSADLTNRKETILHVATQANQANFVRLLLDYVTEEEISEYLESKDIDDNTAFLFAVASGNMKIVDIMGKKNQNLLTERGPRTQLTPLHLAALQGKSEMARYLCENIGGFRREDDGLKLLLFLFVKAGIYDLALMLLKDARELGHQLVSARDDANETVLHILSRTPLGSKQTQQYDLVEYLWKNIFLKLSHEEILENIGGPPHVAFNAVKAGNFKFLELLISTYPYLIWEVDEEGRSIIHIAVLSRQADVFNFTRGIGAIKDIIVRYKDKDENNLLHMAAKLSSEYQQNLVFGAAFHMTLELLWFEVVKKIVPPSFIEEKNGQGLTPQEVFTEDHNNLVHKAQSWTEKTTNCCMLVSTLITTGVFTATFSIPGGVDDNTGSPNYLVDEKNWFMIFSIFDAIAMISSSTSIFIFFSILISRHAEHDFRYTSLPIKLIFGLITLLFSIISMMITFSSAFIMYFNTKNQSHASHHNDGLKWVPILICVLAFIPIPLFALQLWPLCCDIAKLIKFSWNLSRPWKDMLPSVKCRC